MAGGTWTSQNKILPGVYINVQSRESINISVGDRGTVAMAKALSWGPLGEVMEITPGDDLTQYVGYDVTNTNAMFLREMMKGSDVTTGPSQILLYRLGGTGGAKAEATIGALTATAKYEGVRGNDIAIIIAADPDTAGLFHVETVVDGSIVDSQDVTALDDLANNNWVDFAGTGAPVATTGDFLTGGVDPTITTAGYSDFLTAIEPYAFDILAYDGSEATIINAVIQFMTRVNEAIGHKCQAVMAGAVAAAANSKYVIAVNNGVKLTDGTELTAQQAVWWIAGAEAGANYNQSLTYAQYPQAMQANPKLTNAQAQAAIEAGQICFVDDFNIVKVCSDINTKTTVTPKEGKEFKKNRIMRVINQFCNDCYENFSRYFIGKIDNNDPGRSLLKAWIVGYLNEVQANNGIQNFVAEDVTVLPGADVDAVLINVLIQPVDSVEKIYMTVTVTANNVTVATA